MTRAQRSWHRLLWVALAIVIAAGLWWALSIRDSPSVVRNAERKAVEP